LRGMEGSVMAEKSGHRQQKLSAKQKAARIEAAKERERKAKEQEEKAARRKRVFTIVVCVILALALCIPTMALTLFSL